MRDSLEQVRAHDAAHTQLTEPEEEPPPEETTKAVARFNFLLPYEPRRAVEWVHLDRWNQGSLKSRHR